MICAFFQGWGAVSRPALPLNGTGGMCSGRGRDFPYNDE